jgi:6-pyruvoyltetrahydropterin/6-carboxytetrahydropterin synthase
MEVARGDEARLIRTVRLRAVHHYRRAGWSEEENRRVFGAQAEPHEHAWRVEVHVAGSVDPATGWCVELGVLDAHLAAVTAGWDGGDLNALVPEVARGEMTPSTENLARWLHGRLAGALPAPARVLEVRVHESDDLGSAFPAHVDSPIPTEA